MVVLGFAEEILAFLSSIAVLCILIQKSSKRHSSTEDEKTIDEKRNRLEKIVRQVDEGKLDRSELKKLINTI